MPSVMLTAKFVEGINATAGGRDRVEYFDQYLRGLVLRGTSWCIVYRNAQGRLRRMTMGKVQHMSLAKARDLAGDHRATFGKPTHPSCPRDVGAPKWPPHRP